MGSQGGLVSVGSHGGVVLGAFNSASTANATPLASYGAIWSADTGICMAEANCYTKWSMHPIVTTPGTVTSFGISVYGTVDTNAWKQFQLIQGNNSATNLVAPTLVPYTNWFLLDTPSAQGGTGPVANPLTALGQSLGYSGALTAIRAVLTTAFVGTATIALSCLAIP